MEVATQAEEVEVILEVEVTPEAVVTLVVEVVATVVNKAVMEAKAVAAEVIAEEEEEAATVAKATNKVAPTVDIDPPKFQMNDFRSNMLLFHAFYDDTR